MAVSSNTLFHFTKSIEVLKKILADKGFWPRYCLEFFFGTTRAIPLCCFCDIPLSKIQRHNEFYGSYGLGMTKEWGRERNIMPILYVHKNSPFLKIVKNTNNIHNADKNLLMMLAFTKPEIGVNYRKDDSEQYKQYNQYNYYDEREWRFVPINMDNDNLIIPFSCKEDFDSEKLSEITRKNMLTFCATDIKYVIVNDDADRSNLIKIISGMEKWNEDEKERIISRIITQDLIKDDI